MLAVEAEHFKARSWQKLATLAPKESQKVCQNRENIIKMAPKMGSKSMKNRGCVADAFLEGPWAPKGGQRGGAPSICRTNLGAIFGPKIDEKSKKAARRF